MGACGSKPGSGNKLYEKPNHNRLKEDRQANKQFEDTLQFIQQVPLISRLPPADQPLVGAALVLKEFQPGEVVIKEGDTGDEFFLIKSGSAQVFKNNAEIAKLRPGDYFGEASLLEDTPRNATIKVPENAEKMLKTLSITREKFEELGVRERLKFPRRRAVAAEAEGAIKTEADTKDRVYDKTEEEEAQIDAALKNNKYLSAMLKPEQIPQMIKAAYKLDVKEGVNVIEEGSLTADRFYIIASGKFNVTKMIERKMTGGGVSLEDGLLTELTAGMTFGELALLYNAPRAATVEAVEDSTLWTIDRSDFKKILRAQAQKKMNLYYKLVEKTELLSILLREEKQALVECFVEMHYRKGHQIMKEGDMGNAFYILYQGTVSVEKKEGGKVADLVADPDTNQCPYFGENALLKDEPRNATITVESASAAVLVLERSTFESILGPLKDIMAENPNGEGNNKRRSFLSRKGISSIQGTVTNFKPPKFDDLQKIGLLGCGGFGSVHLVRDKSAKKGSIQTYALKMISKGYIVKMHLCDQICNERKILAMTSSCFIAQFYCTFNAKNNIYFLLEACLGGEIFAIYNRKKLHGSRAHCVFYTACVVKALEHLHDRKIIYRDLKPENMLLDTDGYCKLTDMGLAKFVIGRTYTTCGTPDYFAPEIIQSCGHTNAVDWWTLGILVYELLCGHPPFDGMDPIARYRKILGGVNQAKFPSSRFTSEADKDLVKEVCHPDPAQRLPMRPGGVKGNLYTHPFFDKDKWELLASQSLKPPLKPRVKRPDDISNFGGASEEDCPPAIPYVDPGTGWDAEFN